MVNEMGRISVPEQRVAIIFACMALLWMTRPLLTNLPVVGAIAIEAGFDPIMLAPRFL